MKLGVIADDFTGASDIALTLAEAGMQVAQYVGIPANLPASGLDAGVISLKSRTAPSKDAVAQSLDAAEWLLAQGAGQIVFKVCSTFDSTSQGNIGPVLDALADRLGAGGVMVCPAFPENGRSVYQGHLFVGDTLLSESGMQHHPLTPMTDPDLRRVLASQSDQPVAHITHAIVTKGAAAIEAAMPDRGCVIVDAIADKDLIEIGRAAAGAPLLCGGSGIALGLPGNFAIKPAAPRWSSVSGPAVVLSGSCSLATRQQVTTFRQKAPSREIEASAVVAGKTTAKELCQWVLEQDQPAMVYSSADPSAVKAAQEELGKDRVASAVEGLFRDLAGFLADAGIRRIVVAGGETSGAVVLGLDAKELTVGPRIAAGVPVLRLDHATPMALVLKSGNFGGPDFFTEALTRMETAT